MADELDELIDQTLGLKPKAQNTAPAAPASSVPTARDELDDLISKSLGAPAPKTKDQDELDKLIEQSLGGAKTPELKPTISEQVRQPNDSEGLPEVADTPAPATGRSFGDAFVGGIKRGWKQNIEAAVPHLRGMVAEATGNQEEAARFFAEGQAIEKEAPQATQEFRNIAGLEDAAIWAAEKFGEQVPVLGTALIGAGIPALATNLVTRGLMGSVAARALAARVGITTGLGLTSGMEGAGIGSEIREATGSYRPEVAFPAGIAAGALEMVVPFGIARSFFGGREFGSTVARAAGKGLLLESATETAQEAIAIGARKYADPNYDLWSAETGWRLAESAAAGGLVGGGLAGAGRIVSGRGGAEERKLSEADIARAPDIDAEGWNLRPISWLMDKFRRKGEAERQVEFEVNAVGDLVGSVGAQWARAGARGEQFGAIQEFREANTKRYITPLAPDQVFNATELEQFLADRTQEETKNAQIMEVNQGSLQPIAISARLKNLPDVGSPRIFFLPGVSQSEKEGLLERYEALLTKFDSAQDNPLWEDALKREYNTLLDDGLRVIPSYGDSFYYKGELKGKPVSRVPSTSRPLAVVQRAELKTQAFPRTIGWEPGPTGSVFTGHTADYTVNLELFKPGELGALPRSDGRMDRIRDSIRFPASFDDAAKAAVLDELNNIELQGVPGSVTTKLRQLFGQGIYIAPDQSDTQFIAAPGVSLEGKLVQTSNLTTANQARPERTQLLSEWAKDAVDKGTEFQFESTVSMRRQMQIKEVFGKINPILKAMNVPPVPRVIAYTQNNGDYGSYSPATHDIKLWMGGPEEQLLHTIIHEIGHHVTLFKWATTNPAMQEMVWNAYRRDILAIAKHPTREMTRVYTTPEGDTFNPNYTTSFVEWLAEQFLRHVVSVEAGPFSQIEKYFGAMGHEMKNLYSRMKPALFASAINPNYEFTKWMEAVKAGTENTAPHRKLFLELFMEETNEVGGEANAAIEAAITQMQHMLPQGWSINLGNPGEGNVALAMSNKKAVIIGTAAIKYGLTGVISHELIHASRPFFNEAEWQTLVRSAKQIKGLYSLVQNRWGGFYRGQAQQLGIQDSAAWLRSKLEEEAVAVMVSFRARGMPFEEQTRSLLDRLLALLENVANYLRGFGWNNREDILRRFFRGEIAERSKQRELTDIYATWLGNEAMIEAERRPDQIRKVPGTDLTVAIWRERLENRSINALQYRFTTADGTNVGVVYLSHNKKGFEVDYVQVRKPFRRQGRAAQFYKFIEGDMKQAMKPSGYLLADGYAMWKARDPHAVRYHVQSIDGSWLSPNKLRETINIYTALQSQGKKLTPSQAEDFLDAKRLMDKVDPKAWSDPDLEKMFHVGPKSDLYGMGLQMTEQEIGSQDSTLLRDPIPPTGFEDAMAQSAQEAAREQSISMEIPPETAVAPQPETMAMANIFRWNEITAEDRKKLHGIKGEADRISRFTKYWWGLHQLAFANPHITELRNYVNTIEAWSAETERWISRADQTARAWDRDIPADQKNGLADLFFYMTEMEYLTPQEKAANTIRRPTTAEIQAAFQRFKIGPQAQQVYARVEGDFAAFLNEVEAISVSAIQREFAGQRVNGVPSQAEQKALNELAAEMAAMRAKPYFPMTRFGEYTLTVRNPTNGQVRAFYTFGTIRERNNYIKVAHQRHLGSDLSVGRIDESVVEFMGIPGPLLRRIKASLPGLTQDQKDWLDQLEHLTAPERSFRKKWLERKGTPGYSLDAFRVYSHYFFTGSRYLARLKYKDIAQEHVTAIRSSVKDRADGTKRRMISNFAGDHLAYMIEGGRDWGKLKAAIAIWHLGYSPMAAAMNLTQTPMVTLPYLTKLFGVKAANRAVLSANNALKASFGGIWANAPWAGYEKGRLELINQGKIDAGQASELGSYASGNNLLTAIAGTKAQRAFRHATTSAMWMFGKAERFNRELTYATTFKLAIDNPTAPYMQELHNERMAEIDELRTRLQVTVYEAAAIVAAKDAIDRTQGIYAPWARPRFIRQPLAATIGVFFMFTQSMMYAMRNNPGGMIQLLTLMFVAGLMGLPGADDLDKIAEALGRRLFGVDFSVRKEARKFIKQIASGTVFDEIGPDLFLHGVSRFGFGMGMLPDNWGAPRFDASANVSMGKVVPGLGKFASTIGADPTAWDKAFSAGMTDASGAGFGVMFGLLKFLSAGEFSELKHWERAMPRFAKAISKASRYAYDGKETYTSGATMAKFDRTDPDDIATIVAQALGATPLKLSMQWELDSEKRDTALYYRAWKRSLFEQMSKAVELGDAAAKEKVIEGIYAFNDNVTKRGFDGLQIQTKNLKSSLSNRNRNRALQEMGLPTQKGETNLYRQIEEQYPTIVRQKVK